MLERRSSRVRNAVGAQEDGPNQGSLDAFAASPFEDLDREAVERHVQRRRDEESEGDHTALAEAPANVNLLTSLAAIKNAPTPSCRR